MKKAITFRNINLFSFIGLLIVIVMVVITPDSIWKHPKKYYDSIQVLSAVEDYVEETGKLPENLEEIGISESIRNRIYYERITERTFRIWFGTTLGNSLIYESSSKKWRIGG